MKTHPQGRLAHGTISVSVTTRERIEVPRTRGCLGHHAVDHAKVGAVDGPSEAVVRKSASIL